MPADDLAEVIRDRLGWSLDGGVATYRLEAGGWWAMVRAPRVPSRPSHRWTVSGVHPDGNAAWSTWASSAAEAVRVAERWVRVQSER
jgi:hypothetical protein